MRTKFFAIVLTGFLALSCAASRSVFAGGTASTQETPVSMVFTADPVSSYTFVKGDASKFRALNWEPQGYVLGVRDLSFKEKLDDDWTLESEGRGVPSEGDYGTVISLTKEDLGYLKISFDQFRKYYSNAGGRYAPVHLQSVNYTDKDLSLNLGKIGIEAGLTIKNWPDIVFDYEREYKDGTKSLQSWGSLYLPDGTLKKIMPSWEEIDEHTDTFNIKLSDTLFGYNWKADQHWEYTRSNELNEFANNTLDGTANPTTKSDLNDYFYAPRTDLLSTTFNLDRWFLKDKVYGSAGYRFSQIESRELYKLTLLKFDSSPLGTGTNALDSPSSGLYTSHAWVGSLMATLFKPFTAVSRLKVETIHRNGESTYTTSTLANAVTDNQDKIMRYGESLSFRYSGIPRVALYNDYEFEQTRNNLYYNYLVSSSSFFRYQNINEQLRGSGTLGAQIIPLDKVTMTMQGRYGRDENMFSRPLIVSSGGAPYTEMDEQAILTEEASARIAWKPCPYFQPSFRYQLVDNTFKVSSYVLPAVFEEAGQISSVYTWEVVSQPSDKLLLNAMFSFTDGKVITTDRYSDTARNIPTTNFDTFNALFSAEYAVDKDWVLTSMADYTRAANFNDYSSIGMPLGTDFYKMDLSFGLRWTPKKDLTVEPRYGYYVYRTAANAADVGDYNAQMISVDVKLIW